jgi:hypothetical protein
MKLGAQEIEPLTQDGRCRKDPLEATEANRLRGIFDNTVQETIQPSCCGLPPV